MQDLLPRYPLVGYFNPSNNSEASWYLKPIEVFRYPNGEPYVRYNDIQYLKHILVRPPVLHQNPLEILYVALYIIDVLEERGVRPTLGIPFLPGMRQDRRSYKGDGLFTARSIARDVAARGYEYVWTLDPHSDVMPALISNLRQVNIVHNHLNAWVGATYQTQSAYDGVVAPDGGAMKRASKMAEYIGRRGVPVYQGWKRRNVEDGSLSGFGIEDLSDLPANGRLLLVDDICDGGGTFVGLAEAIKEQVPDIKLDLFISHGLFTKGVDHMEIFDNIITTDSVVHPKDILGNEKIHVLNVSYVYFNAYVRGQADA